MGLDPGSPGSGLPLTAFFIVLETSDFNQSSGLQKESRLVIQGFTKFQIRKGIRLGHLGGSAVECLPLAQGVIPGSRIESHIGLPAWSLLLLLPVSLSLSLCVFIS